MAQYFLLDSYSFKDNRKVIWNNNAPKVYPLFATTELDHYKEEGPILITGVIDKLIQTCQSKPESWPGLFISSSATDEELLTHLRNLLFVTYPPESKGVLTYYDKHTASYLFNHTEAEYLSTWLGPIQSLSWYGGTWQQEGNNSLAWQEIHQPAQVKAEPIIAYKYLTQAQQDALTLARQEKYAYDWSIKHDQAYNTSYQYLQEAIQLEFDDLDALQAYLNLRLQYPQGLTPVQLSGSTAEQRLQNLENFWKTNGQV